MSTTTVMTIVATGLILSVGAFWMLANWKRLEFRWEKAELLQTLATIEQDFAATDSGTFDLKDGVLTRSDHGRILAVRRNGHTFVRFDKGGGHRGSVGYVYASDPNLFLDTRGGILNFPEGLTLQSVAPLWFWYESTEE